MTSFSIRPTFIFDKVREGRKNGKLHMRRLFRCGLSRKPLQTIAIRKSLLCRWSIMLRFLRSSVTNVIYTNII
ncbi:hypothetical protein D3C73_1346270 [compost metagenome]